MFFREKTRGKMIDMHCHVLPGVDDGAQSMEQTMEMLRIACGEGIEAMIVTPHFKAGHHSANPETVTNLIRKVQENAERSGYVIRLYPGNEVLYFAGAEELLERDAVLTLNNTDRVLVEFSPAVEYIYLRNALDSVRAQGYTPVLAHVERYECMVKSSERVRELKQMGAEIQINAQSAAGKLGKRVQHFLYALLKEKLVDYVGTDAHNTEERAPKFQECYQMLSKRFDTAYLDKIFYGNALAIIEAE